MKKTKKKSKPIIKPTIELTAKYIAKYVGDAEVMGFKKIINKGDLVPEMSIDEARVRKDFIVVNVNKED